MKVLSLRQPWAWLVVQGLKPIENRRWNTGHRGPLLIHASKTMRHADYLDAVAFAKRAMPEVDVPPADRLDRAAIIGWVDVKDVIPPCVAKDVEPTLFRGFADCVCGRKWHMGDQYGFILDEERGGPTEPVAFSGLLGMTAVSNRVLQELLRTTHDGELMKLIADELGVSVDRTEG